MEEAARFRRYGSSLSDTEYTKADSRERTAAELEAEEDEDNQEYKNPLQVRKSRAFSRRTLTKISKINEASEALKLGDMTARYKLNRAAKKNQKSENQQTRASLIQLVGQIRPSGRKRNPITLFDKKKNLYNEAKEEPIWNTRKFVINPVDKSEIDRFPKNVTRTSEYTFANFWVKNILKQLNRKFYLWLAAMAIIQAIPDLNINRNSSYSSLFQFFAVVIVCGVKNLIEDFQHRKEDDLINYRCCHIIDGRKPQICAKYWKDIGVGQILYVCAGEEFPADSILVGSSNSDGTAYADTSKINGITYLTTKHSVKETKSEVNFTSISAIRGRITCRQPDAQLETFEGNFKLDAYPRASGLTFKNFIHKGTILRNTNWVYAIVVYAGGETKIAQAEKVWKNIKISSTEKGLNFTLSILLTITLIYSLVSIILWSIWTTSEDKNSVFWLLDSNWNASGGLITVGLSFFVAYGSLLPATIYLVTDVFHIMQYIYLKQNLSMAKQTTTDYLVPFNKNMSLNDSIGEVDYIFMDKTGTLTKNLMKFTCCSINGRLYGGRKRWTTKVSQMSSLNMMNLNASSILEDNLTFSQGLSHSYLNRGLSNYVKQGLEAESTIKENKSLFSFRDSRGRKFSLTREAHKFITSQTHSAIKRFPEENSIFGKLPLDFLESRCISDEDIRSIESSKYFPADDLMLPMEASRETTLVLDDFEQIDLLSFVPKKEKSISEDSALGSRDFSRKSKKKVTISGFDTAISNLMKEVAEQELKKTDTSDMNGVSSARLRSEGNFNWGSLKSGSFKRCMSDETLNSLRESKSSLSDAIKNKNTNFSRWTSFNFSETHFPGKFKDISHEPENLAKCDFDDLKIFRDLKKRNSQSYYIDLFLKAMAMCNTVNPLYTISSKQHNAESSLGKLSNLMPDQSSDNRLHATGSRVLDGPKDSSLTYDRLSRKLSGKKLGAGLSGSGISKPIRSLHQLSSETAQYDSMVSSSRSMNTATFFSDNQTSSETAFAMLGSMLKGAITAVKYQTSDPDEACLVSAARYLNYSLISRDGDSLMLEIGGITQQFEIIALNQFTNVRGRMSILVRLPGNSLGSFLFAKGSAAAILETISNDNPNAEEFKKKIYNSNAEFAKQGLRTFAFACKRVGEKDTQLYLRLYKELANCTEEKEQKQNFLISELEANLAYLGIAALEDKIQDGVCHAIQCFKEAGIKMAMVTGDNLEYAMHIANSAKMIRNADAVIYVLIEENTKKLSKDCAIIYENFKEVMKNLGVNRSYTLVLNGFTFDAFLRNRKFQDYLINMICGCEVLIASSMFPGEKAELINLINKRFTPKLTTLAIGDGVNDIAMLKAAKIGVCIFSEHNDNTLGSSDYSLPEFQQILPLLFLHGRKNLKNLCLAIYWTISRGLSLSMILFLYNVYTHWNFANPFNLYSLMTSYLLWTFIPLLVFEFIDRNLVENFAMGIPGLYLLGRRKLYRNPILLTLCMLESAIFAIAMYYFTFYAYEDNSKSEGGIPIGMESLGGIFLLENTAVFMFRLFLELQQGISLFLFVSLFLIGVCTFMLTYYIEGLIEGSGQLLINNIRYILQWTPIYILMMMFPFLVLFVFLISEKIKTIYYPNFEYFLHFWIQEAGVRKINIKKTGARKDQFERKDITRILKFYKVLFKQFFSMITFQNVQSSNSRDIKPEDVTFYRTCFNFVNNIGLSDILLPKNVYYYANNRFVKPRASPESETVNSVLELNRLKEIQKKASGYRRVHKKQRNLEGHEVWEKMLDNIEETLEIVNKPEKFSDLISRVTLKFHLIHLESDFKVHLKNSFVRFNLWYQIMFCLIALYYLGNMLLEYAVLEDFAAGNQESLPVWKAFPTILLIIALLAAAIAALNFKIFTRDFESIILTVAVLLVLQHAISYQIQGQEGVLTAVVIPVFTFVILRIQLIEAVILNVAHLGLFVGRYLINEALHSYSLIFYLPGFIGVILFAAFAGYRLEYSQRKAFILDYSADASRRKQREILNTMLPSFVIDEIINSDYLLNGTMQNSLIVAEDKGIISVLFCDVYEFQSMISAMEPKRLVELLDNLFLFFDKTADIFGCTKIETVFETYMAASGIEVSKTGTKSRKVIQQHAIDAMDMALSMLEVGQHITYTVTHTDDDGNTYEEVNIVKLKIGIHSGRVISGVVGVKKPQYALFGDTVNTASRMKTTGEPGYVHISEATYELLKLDQSLIYQQRQTQVKGKGLMNTYLLVQVIGSSYPYFNEEKNEKENHTPEFIKQNIDELNNAESLASSYDNRRIHTRRMSRKLTHTSVNGITMLNSQPFSALAQLSEAAKLEAEAASSGEEETHKKNFDTKTRSRSQVFKKAEIHEAEKTFSDVPAYAVSETPENLDENEYNKNNTVAKSVITFAKTEENDSIKDKTGNAADKYIPNYGETSTKAEFLAQNSLKKIRNFSKYLTIPGLKNLNLNRFQSKGLCDEKSSIEEGGINNDIKAPPENFKLLTMHLSQQIKEKLQRAFTRATGIKLWGKHIFNITAKSFQFDKKPELDSPEIESETVTGTLKTKELILLRFFDNNAEAKFRNQYYNKKTNIDTIEHALAIFSVIFIIQTLINTNVTRSWIYKNQEYDLALPNNAYWWVRTIYTLGIFSLWLIFHYSRISSGKKGDSTSRWMILVLNIVIISASCVFLLQACWALPTLLLDPSKIVWTKVDTIQLFFYLVVLHHNTGLLFRHCLVVDTLLLILSLSFLLTTAISTPNTVYSTSLIPAYFFFNLASAYYKEFIERLTFHLNESARRAEEKASDLLKDMLPKQIIEEFEQDKLELAYVHDKVAFLFADICGFTSWATGVDASEVVYLLQKVFSSFDKSSSKYGLYKLCTIGDAYVAVSEPVTQDTPQSEQEVAANLERILEMANSMHRSIALIRERLNIPTLGMRIGLHFGSCTGGVIGSGRLRYDIWGIDVLTANLMETNGEPGRINVSSAFKDKLDYHFPGRFEFQFNKRFTVTTYLVDCYLITERPEPELPNPAVQL